MYQPENIYSGTLCSFYCLQLFKWEYVHETDLRQLIFTEDLLLFSFLDAVHTVELRNIHTFTFLLTEQNWKTVSEVM